MFIRKIEPHRNWLFFSSIVSSLKHVNNIYIFLSILLLKIVLFITNFQCVGLIS